MSKVDSIQIPVFETEGPDYETDFCVWLEEQGRRLRLLRIPGFDTENLAEEIEGLSRSDKRTLRSHVCVLLTHLLKWRYQSALAGSSWETTVRVQRKHIRDLLNDSPSLRPTMGEVIDRVYEEAVNDAVKETGLPALTFPAGCEWESPQVLDPEFLPEPREGG